MLIDTHCHLNMMVKKEFDRPLTAEEIAQCGTIITQAATQQVTMIVNVGTNLIENRNTLALANQYDAVWATVGIHPTDCTATWRDDLAELEQQVQQPKVVAVGEIGLDFYHPGFAVDRQEQAFAAQLELAIRYNKAVVVHTRNAATATLAVLAQYRHQLPRVVIHCFGQDSTFAETVIGWGMLIGIGGALTYPKNDALRDIVRQVSLESIVLETDAPFLPPQSIRGQQNNPAQIATIAAYIAELRGITGNDVAAVTTTTARRLFDF